MENSENNQSPQAWEKKFLQELAMSSLVEKRRTRRWGIFFKTVTFLYLLFFLMLMVGLLAPDEFQDAGLKKQAPHTAVVNVNGVIMDESEASADNVITGLRNAFQNKHTKGVIIRINSPGGTPVQAGYINDEILRLKEKYPDIPVYAVVRDVAASGGYYVAVAADEIYVDKASIVGSIGVLMNGFGFVGGMEKLGVERRLLTAGEHKGINDPFSPMQEFDREHVQNLLDQMHRQFIAAVKKGRGERLKPDDKIFSGLYWTGEESVELGLADGFGSASYVARELIEQEEIVDYTPAEDLLERFARKMGASTGETLSRIWGFGSMPLPR
jgi:protease-4